MPDYKRITVESAKALITQANVVILDVRDAQSYTDACIEGAIHMSNDNLPRFVEETDKSSPLLVYCYHGNSSQAAAQFFMQHGFTEVYSLDGGFEAWSKH